MLKKYPDLIGDCKHCELGCFRLEDIYFRGTYNCQYCRQKEDKNNEKNVFYVQKGKRYK